MTVKTFEKKYNALQKEGNEIYADIKPLLIRLTGLARRCLSLYKAADLDKNLYINEHRRLPSGFVDSVWNPDGWNYRLLLRLSDMEWLLDNLCGVSNCLYNLKHTPFRKRSKKGKKPNAR